jgi:hypothetical protein
MKTLRFYLLISLFLLFIFPLTASAESTPEFGMYTSNMTNFKFEVAPGSVVVEDVILINMDAVQTITLELTIKSGELVPGNPPLTDMPIEWADLPVNSMELKPGESKMITLVFTIPKNTAIDTYGGFFRAKLNKSVDIGGVIVSPAIGADVVFKINPNLSPAFDVQPNILQKAYFYTLAVRNILPNINVTQINNCKTKYYPDVIALYTPFICYGYERGLFSEAPYIPIGAKDFVTRSEAAKKFVEISGMANLSIPAVDANYYSDVSADKSYYNNAQILAAYNITGIQKGEKFKPGSVFTKEDWMLWMKNTIAVLKANGLK